MSFMPPDPTQAPNGNAPPQSPSLDDTINECINAIRVAGKAAATSQDPEAFSRFGQGAFFFAQTLEKLMPQKPNPDVALKAQASMIQHGAQLGEKRVQAEDKLAAEAMKASAKQDNMNKGRSQGATDGNQHDNRQH